MKYTALFLVLIAPLLSAKSCEPQPLLPPPPDANQFCAYNDYTISGHLRSAVDGVSGAVDSILMGKPSVDRRATVRVKFGQSYCSGVVLSPHTVLSAGHCGYLAEHDIAFGAYDGPVYDAYDFLVHPDYWDWINNDNFEGRKSDLMLLYVEEELPGPYPAGIYDHTNLALYYQCAGAFAQGWGRWEGEGLSLRETKYVITRVTDPKYLTSRAADVPEGEEHGRICFGDSGGPLYVDVNGMLYLAGVTTTTMSSDCLVGGTHVRVAYYKDWIMANMK